MKELFEVKNNTVVYAPQVLLINEFKNLWDRDKSKTKDQANKELAYIYYATDYRSIYSNYIGDEKIQRIKRDLKLDKSWKEDKDIKAALDKYQELSKTQSMGLLEDAKEAIEKLRAYFKTVSLTTLDDNGKPIYSAKDLISNLAALGKVVSGLKELETEVLKEQQGSNNMRGGRGKSAFEDTDSINDI